MRLRVVAFKILLNLKQRKEVMSRITFTKKGNSRNTVDVTRPIDTAPLFLRIVWTLGNLFGFNQIKRNAVKSRGYGIKAGATYKAFNFGRWVAYKQLSNAFPALWFKRTLVDERYQMTPVSHTNTTMQILRVPARMV